MQSQEGEEKMMKYFPSQRSHGSSESLQKVLFTPMSAWQHALSLFFCCGKHCWREQNILPMNETRTGDQSVT